MELADGVSESSHCADVLPLKAGASEPDWASENVVLERITGVYDRGAEAVVCNVFT